MNNDELDIHFIHKLLSTADNYHLLSIQIPLIYSLLIIIIIYYNYLNIMCYLNLINIYILQIMHLKCIRDT